jgi:small GTP-binding protein
MEDTLTLILNIIIVGETGVGKTSLLNRYTQEEFIEKTRPTIGVDYLIKLHTINGKKLNVRFWDTAGQEKYKAICKKFYKDAHGVVLVYDVTDKDSFNYVANWKKEIEENCKKGVVVLLIGNKSDIIEKKTVSEEDGRAYAETNGFYFLETSAKLDTNVTEAFNIIVEKAAEKPLKEIEEEEKPDQKPFPRFEFQDEKRNSCC